MDGNVAKDSGSVLVANESLPTAVAVAFDTTTTTEVPPRQQMNQDSPLATEPDSDSDAGADDERSRAGSGAVNEAGGDPQRQTACDQAVVWSGNLLLVLAILDVAFFTIWNFLSPAFLESDCVRKRVSTAFSLMCTSHFSRRFSLLFCRRPLLWCSFASTAVPLTGWSNTGLILQLATHHLNFAVALCRRAAHLVCCHSIVLVLHTTLRVVPERRAARTSTR